MSPKTFRLILLVAVVILVLAVLLYQSANQAQYEWANQLLR